MLNSGSELRVKWNFVDNSELVSLISQWTHIKGENLRHDHLLITINIFSIKRK